MNSIYFTNRDYMESADWVYKKLYRGYIDNALKEYINLCIPCQNISKSGSLHCVAKEIFASYLSERKDVFVNAVNQVLNKKDVVKFLKNTISNKHFTQTEAKFCLDMNLYGCDEELANLFLDFSNKLDKARIFRDLTFNLFVQKLTDNLNYIDYQIR